MSNPCHLPTPRFELFADAPTFRDAFERTSFERGAVRMSEFVWPTFDVPHAVATYLTVRPRLAALRDEVAALNAPAFDPDVFTRVDRYARATGYAWLRHICGADRVDALGALATDAVARRARLLLAAEALAPRGFLPASDVAVIRECADPLAIAYDLYDLVDMFRAQWAAIERKTAVTHDELDAAEAVAARVEVAIAERVAPANALYDTRIGLLAAVSLFVGAYREVRRLAQYMRWKHRDADEFAPSLFAGTVVPHPCDAGSLVPERPFALDECDDADDALAPSAPAAVPPSSAFFDRR